MSNVDGMACGIKLWFSFWYLKSRIPLSLDIYDVPTHSPPTQIVLSSISRVVNNEIRKQN